MIIQIYEIQTPSEVEKIMGLGVTHMGSVVLSQETWRVPLLRETVRLIQSIGCSSSLIPLFSDADVICKALDYYTPDIVHLCDAPVDPGGRPVRRLEESVRSQETVRKRYPEIAITRTIPIPRPGAAHLDRILSLARTFEPISDTFLIDTVLGGDGDSPGGTEPVEGFVGITGKICDWEAAKALVRQSRVPIVLAGGISPENVFEAIRQVAPAGVDSCTGTNRKDPDGHPVRFQKDRSKVEKLVQEVCRAIKKKTS